MRQGGVSCGRHTCNQNSTSICFMQKQGTKLVISLQWLPP